MNNLKLIDELERDEGLRLKVYADQLGIPTVGIGRNLRDKGITRGEAYHLLNNDIDEIQADLDAALPWWRRLDEVRQRVLANMCFNLGIHGLLKFEHMLAHAMISEFDMAAAEMVGTAWAKQVGPRAVRLAEMMRHGGGE